MSKFHKVFFIFENLWIFVVLDYALQHVVNL